jgi:hypothetical protein
MKKRILRPEIVTQWLGTVSEGKQLELFSEIDGIGHSLVTIVADDSDESLWVEIYIGENIVQIPLELIRNTIESASGEVHSETWYEKNVYSQREDT